MKCDDTVVQNLCQNYHHTTDVSVNCTIRSHGFTSSGLYHKFDNDNASRDYLFKTRVVKQFAKLEQVNQKH